MIRDKKKLLLVVLYAAIIVAAGVVGYRYWAMNNAMGQIYDVSFNQYQGPLDANKVIYEFLDYRCSYCRDMHPVMKELLERNPDVKIVYRHYPVFGRPSVIEADIALAAGMRSNEKFLEAHHFLMTRKEPVSDREIDDFARELGFDVQTFRRDMKSHDIGTHMLQTLDLVEALGINSTPTFIVGNKIMALKQGMPTVEDFERALAEAYGE